MKVLKLALWAFFTIFLLAVVGSLTGQNSDRVSFAIFNYTSPEYPKWGLLLGSFVLGAFVSSIFFVLQLIVLETRNIRLRRLNKKLERALQASTTPTYSTTNGNGQAAPSPLSPSGPTVSLSSSPTLNPAKAFEDEDV
jgi:uncharacterized membrane protein YciS (DUF1049 family)